MPNRKRKSPRTGAFGGTKSRRSESVPTSSREHVDQAIIKKENGDLRGGFLDADRAVNKDHKNGAAYLSRGTANFALRRYEQAIADFTEALRCPYNSKFPRTRFLCLCWWERADSKAALGDLTGALN